MRKWADNIVGWALLILIVGGVGVLVWSEYLRSDPVPSFSELQSAVAASQSCDELRAAHFAALDAEEAEAIDEQQMNTLWRGVLDQAEALQPGSSLSTQLTCTGIIGTCPRGTPADICADLLSDDF